MTLFTKPGCKKCDYVKEAVDLAALNINIEVLTPDNVDALAHLTWHESVGTAERVMPILVLDDCSVMTGAIEVKNYLLRAAQKMKMSAKDRFQQEHCGEFINEAQTTDINR